MTKIRAEIEAAALEFADAIFQILRRNRLEDLAIEIRATEPARARSSNASSVRAVPTSRRRAATGRSKLTASTDPSAIRDLAKRVVSFVVDNGESGRKAIVAGVGGDPDLVQKALVHARSSGALAIKGEKRNARYVATGKGL